MVSCSNYPLSLQARLTPRFEGKKLVKRPTMTVMSDCVVEVPNHSSSAEVSVCYYTANAVTHLYELFKSVLFCGARKSTWLC